MTAHPHERRVTHYNDTALLQPHPYRESEEAPGFCNCNLPPGNRLHRPVRLRLVVTAWAGASAVAASTIEEVLHEEVLLTGWPA